LLFAATALYNTGTMGHQSLKSSGK